MKHTSLCFLVLFSWLSQAAHGIDLCIFFNTCNQATNNDNARSDSGPPATVVDGDWVEAVGSNNGQVYHFAHNSANVNWYDADEYCSRKGGFLAEPLSEVENNFIKGQAGKYPNINWWIGLRETEDCKCRATDARAAEFEASLDYNTLGDRSANGYVKTRCPSVGTYQKVCTGKLWRWGYSAVRLLYSDWNRDTGEPNGDQEHCVSLWVKAGYKWGDWHCNTNTDAGHGFKPICQKDKNADDVSEGDEDYDHNDDHTGNDDYDNDDDDYGDEDDYDDEFPPDNSAKCVDQGVVYKSFPKDKITTIFNVDSHELCRKHCAENSQCRYWTWKNRRNKKCSLKSAVRPSGFRKRRNNAVSGTVLNNCRPQTNTKEDHTADPDYCMEFGAQYVGGQEPKRVNNVNSVDECRIKCLQEPGCVYYTFKRGRRRRRSKCFLRSRNDFSVEPRRSATSGTVAGRCSELELADMNECKCTTLSSSSSNNNNNGGPISLVDILSGASTSNVRIANKDTDDGPIEARTNDCGLQQINRCTHGHSDSQTFTRGDYCVDYEINYEEGGQFKRINNVASAELCRQQCTSEPRCNHWTWKGSSTNKRCLLKSSALFTPRSESGTVSGTTKGLCRSQPLERYGFCECVELAVDEYDEDYVDIVELGFVRSGLGCPSNQGRRCYSQIADGVKPTDLRSPPSNSGFTSSRINFG